MSRPQLILGVDGGGTKTIAWLAAAKDGPPCRVIGCGAGGPANVRSCGPVAAGQGLSEAVGRAFDDAGLLRRPVAAACLALAGVDRPDDRQAASRLAAEQDVAERLRIVHDALPLLHAAGGPGWGVALIAGTGSFAFGSSPSGQSQRCGGWGRLLGDEGSGYWVALAGLRAAVRAADGRGPSTILLDLFLRRLHLTEPSQLIAATQHAAQAAELAAHSRCVFEAADRNDSVAMDIERRAADELVELAAAVASRLEGPPPAPLAMGGSVLLHRPRLRERLLQQLSQREIAVSPRLVPDPVEGAVELARQLARGAAEQRP